MFEQILFFAGLPLQILLELVIAVSFYNQIISVSTQYCNAPIMQEMRLSAINNSRLRTSVIDIFSVVPNSMACGTLCAGNVRCSYIGMQMSSQTCSLLSFGGPTRAFMFDKLFIVQQIIVQVNISKIYI